MTTQPSPNAKRNVMILAIVLLLFAAYLLSFLLPDFLRTVTGPQAVTMSQAAEMAAANDAYVLITDGQWECETIEYVRGRSSTSATVETRSTEVFRTSAGGNIVLLATLSGEQECDELNTADLSGYLNRMSAEREQELINDVRLARFINATVFLEMCGYCGPSNSLIGTLFGLAFALAGLALMVYSLRL